MDVDISMWILEFLLRNLVDDGILKQLILILPLPKNTSIRWKKTLLLRTIDSEILDGSVSEKTLDLLEMVMELDRREGFVVFDSMKAAYCAVAVDCTARHIKEKDNCFGEYFNAVVRIWRERIGYLKELYGVGLTSKKLIGWMDEIEAAVWDDQVSKKISMMNTRSEALKAVRAYLDEAWKLMGPTFLEVAAKKMGKSLMESQSLDEHINSGHVEKPTILPSSNLGVCNESNLRNADRAAEKAVSSPNVHPDHGGDDGGTYKTAAITENQVEHVQIPHPNINGNLGVVDEGARKDTCHFKETASSMSDSGDLDSSRRLIMKDNDRCGNGTSSVLHDQPTDRTETNHEEISNSLHDVNGHCASAQTNKDRQVQEKPSDVCPDRFVDDRPTPVKDKSPNRDGVAITDVHIVRNITFSLSSDAFGLSSNELIDVGKNQDEDNAATSSIASRIRDRSTIKRKYQSGPEDENQDIGAGIESPSPVVSQAVGMAVPCAGGKFSITDELTVRDEDQDDSGAAMTLIALASNENGVENGNVRSQYNYVAGQGKRARRGTKIAEVEESSIETSNSKFDHLSSAEVIKVQAALLSSSLELGAVVTDPLPEALNLAEAVIHAMDSNQSFANNRPDRQNNEPRPSLMESNGTARTYEWDDSIDDSHEETRNSRRIRLTSPNRNVVSPLKNDRPANAHRRKRKPWTIEEEDTLRTGVQKFGRGKWKLILNSYRHVFEERTDDDLRVKWRVLTK